MSSKGVAGVRGQQSQGVKDMEVTETLEDSAGGEMRRLEARVQEMQEAQMEAAKLMAEEWNKQMVRAEEWKAEEEDKMRLMIAEGEKRNQLALQAYMLEMETRLSTQAAMKARSLEVEVQACKELVQGSRQDAGRMEGMMNARLTTMQMQMQQMYNMMRAQHGGNDTCEESSGELRRIESMLRKANGLPVRGQQQATTTGEGRAEAERRRLRQGRPWRRWRERERAGEENRRRDLQGEEKRCRKEGRWGNRMGRLRKERRRGVRVRPGSTTTDRWAGGRRGGWRAGQQPRGRWARRLRPARMKNRNPRGLRWRGRKMTESWRRRTRSAPMYCPRGSSTRS